MSSGVAGSASAVAGAASSAPAHTSGIRPGRTGTAQRSCGPVLRLRVLPELLPHHAADLAERAARLERGAHWLEQVDVASAGGSQLLEGARDRRLVAILLERLEPLDLPALGLGIHPQDLHLVHPVGDVLVHPDHDVLLLLVALLIAPGRLLV